MKKYKVGYTTGVFDMFHIGHLNVIRRSKEMCDYLIVGVTTDECVQDYKNKTPIIPYEHRREIIESVRYVDQVVPQVNMNKMEAWEKLKFDAIFHGSDWQNTEMYTKLQRDFEPLGVDVVFLPHTDGISSTILRDRLNEEEG